MAALLSALAGCAALAGAYPDAVSVTSAKAIEPSPSWSVETASFYKPEPVSVPLCRVEGTIEGNIGFELWLPSTWNGRLLGAGVGGDAGVFNYRDMSVRVMEGFATFTTDSGHKQSQTRWMADAKARTDYEHRAVHLTAVAAKKIAAAFYGRAVQRSYFTGCSGGGRQALKEMQVYPADFDGVIAGAPGPYMPLQSVRMMWFSLQQKWHPNAALSDTDWSLYESSVTKQCDAQDGVADGIVTNPMACAFHTKVLACKPGQSKGCIAAPKLAMLDSIIAPMPDEQGRVMDGGLFPGVRTRPGPPSPLLRAMWADGVYDEPDWDENTFQRTAALDAANRMMPELRADRTMIGSFLKLGGKAILYQGWADPSTNAGPTIDYYRALSAANDGYDALSRSVRLFMVPGMYHCGGGPGANAFGGSGQPAWPGEPKRDALWALIDWVEQGGAPERLEATRISNGREEFTRALCPYPQSAVYDGNGPKTQASSYRCAIDPVLAKTLR